MAASAASESSLPSPRGDAGPTRHLIPALSGPTPLLASERILLDQPAEDLLTDVEVGSQQSGNRVD